MFAAGKNRLAVAAASALLLLMAACLSSNGPAREKGLLSDAEISQSQAMAHYAQGLISQWGADPDPKTALEEFSKGAEEDSGSALLVSKRAGAMLDMGDATNALAFLESTGGKFGDSSEVWYAKGNALDALMRHGEAAAAYTRAAGISAAKGELHDQLNMLYFAALSHDSAKDADSMLKSLGAMYDLIAANASRFAEGDARHALADDDSMEVLDPTYRFLASSPAEAKLEQFVQNHIVDCYHAGRRDDALKLLDWRLARTDASDGKSRYAASHLYAAASRSVLEDGISDRSQEFVADMAATYLKRSPLATSATVVEMLARHRRIASLEQLATDSSSLHAADAFLEEPQYAGSLSVLALRAMAAMHDKDYGAAERLSREILDGCASGKFSLGPFDMNSVEYSLASALDSLGRYDESDRIFRSLFDDEAFGAQAMNYLAYSFALRGENLIEAEELSKRSLEGNPNKAAFIDTLSWIYFKQGRYQEAYDKLASIPNLVDEGPEVCRHMGDTLEMLDRLPEAITYWAASYVGDPTDAELEGKLRKAGVDIERLKKFRRPGFGK